MRDSLQHYLHHHPPLRQLRTRLQEQQHLLQQVQQWLAAPLSSHCHSATLQKTRLILTADSPIWADQLRYQTPSLLHRLRTTHPSLTTIKVRSRPVFSPSGLLRSTTSIQRPDAHRHARLINDSACDIQDPILKAALKKLALTLGNVLD